MYTFAEELSMPTYLIDYIDSKIKFAEVDAEDVLIEQDSYVFVGPLKRTLLILPKSAVRSIHDMDLEYIEKND